MVDSSLVENMHTGNIMGDRQYVRLVDHWYLTPLEFFSHNRLHLWGIPAKVGYQ